MYPFQSLWVPRVKFILLIIIYTYFSTNRLQPPFRWRLFSVTRYFDILCLGVCSLCQSFSIRSLCHIIPPFFPYHFSSLRNSSHPVDITSDMIVIHTPGCWCDGSVRPSLEARVPLQDQNLNIVQLTKINICIHSNGLCGKRCWLNEEIQSAYFDHQQVTLHPMVMHWRDPDWNTTYMVMSDDRVTIP